MRVLHVQRVKGIGGSERHLLALLPELEARGIETQMVVLRTGDGDRFVDEMRRVDIDTHTVPGRGHFQPELVPILVSKIRRFRPDVVHTHLVDADVYGQLAAFATRVPAVSSVHGTPAFYGREPYRTAGRVAGRLARRRIAISHHVAAFLEAGRLAPPSRIRVVPYGIRLDDPGNGHEGPARREALGWTDEEFVVGIVARVIPGKGHDRLVRAVARAAEVRPELRLVVVGDGPECDQLAAVVRAEAASRVAMVGFVDDVRPYVEACDVIVVPTEPTLSEGFGLSALEAMAAAKPVVVTAVGSLPEVVVDGSTGIVVAPASTSALADALVALAHNRARAAALGQAGRVRAEQEYGIRRMIDDTIAVYEEVA
jgi:glycosyltransferase involved in cell wall biosynthesis